ncbi:MAG: exodeoxyribonuclease VII large subunit [Saccharofermentans sp.]|nr:exodeoxyribonuclease VII large subunit [Saccharofermentans sp.]
MFEFKTISELNRYTIGVLSSDDKLSNLAVTGEISGFKVYSSGHAYFTLKDSESQIACVMWASRVSTMHFKPKDGDRVTVTGFCTVYSANGKYQIQCNSMKLAGQGTLKEQLKLLYNKLNQEGLFASEHKKILPIKPSRIGIITSPTGAVIHDMIVKLRERNPYFDVLVYPAAVQGENCPSEAILGLKYFIESNNVDVIIIARGGGSIEDLWGFNDETLARTVYDCPIPVISAIGHETDYTILDFVADKRSPTPTAAAEDVLATFDELQGQIDVLRERINTNMRDYLASKRFQLYSLTSNEALYSPEFTVKLKRKELDSIVIGLNVSIANRMIFERNTLSKFIDSLAMLGPHNVLKRGYSYVTSDEGMPIVSTRDVNVESKLRINFADGYADAVVTDVIMTEER